MKGQFKKNQTGAYEYFKQKLCKKKVQNLSLVSWKL